jgi:hypothetical protein
VGDVVFTEISEMFTVDDLRAYLVAVPKEPAFRPGMPSLVDCRKVKALLSPDELRLIAADVAQMSPAPAPGRCAVLAATDVVFGLVRMYEAYSEGSPVEVRVFRAVDEAMAWLTGPPLDD